MLLGSCAAVGPDFKRPEVPWLIRWPGGSLASLNAEQHGKSRAQTEEWWRNFNDPVLDQLIAELLFKHGNDSDLDVQQAKAQYLGTLSTIPQLEGSLRQTQNALATLLARPPGPLPEMATGKDSIPQAELGVIVDLPADLLRRRPDVRTAEMQLAAQSALIGVSQADLYPSIALLGSLGLSATSLSGSPRTFAWGIGPSLVWNVFDHGRLTGGVLVQDARFQQVYEQYQGTVLQAAREVDDAAVGFATSREQIPILEEAVKAAQRSLAIASIQYREGVANFERVLDIDPSQYRIALERSRSDYESMRRSVNASAATVEAARASLQAAQANHVKAAKDATRHERRYAEDPGAISVRRLEVAQGVPRGSLPIPIRRRKRGRMRKGRDAPRVHLRD